MKQVTINIAAELVVKNQYGIKEVKPFEKIGDLYNYLIAVAKEKRRESREKLGIAQGVFRLDGATNVPELVTIASYSICVSNVISLLNGHGVEQFEIIEN